MQAKGFLASLAVLMLAGASAQSAPLEDMGIAKGVCEKFSIAGKPTTKECTGKLLNTTYADGRVGFYFTFKRGSIITFSGYDRPNPTKDTDLISVDKIIFSVGGATREFAATGSCRYGNFRAGHKRVTCKGSSDDGQPFEAVFRMTSPPEPM